MKTAAELVKLIKEKGYVVVEHMPESWRESHRAARNWGQYPSNGAVRVVMAREDADELIGRDIDGYDCILRDATISDLSRYGRLNNLSVAFF